VVCSSRSAQDFRKPLWVFSRWIWGVPFYPVEVTSDWHWWKESAIDRQSCCEGRDFNSGPRQQPSTELPPNFFVLLQSIGSTATVRTNLEPKSRAESAPRRQTDTVRTVNGCRLLVPPSPENFDLETVAVRSLSISKPPISIIRGEFLTLLEDKVHLGFSAAAALRVISSSNERTRIPEDSRCGFMALHPRNVSERSEEMVPKFDDVAELR
jgi:hypothetical protein